MLLDLVLLKEKYNLDIKGVYHIGAHFGQEAPIYDTLNIENRFYFEPLPQNFKVLSENITKGQAVNIALGNRNGMVNMNVETANQGQSSSILEPKKHLEQYPHIQFTSKVMVGMSTLDDFIEENNINISNYNFINIDVQGYELEVFKGAIKTLNDIDYIMTEVNRDEVYKDCVRVEELDNFLSQYGFKRVETTWDGVTWGDALYIKEQNG